MANEVREQSLGRYTPPTETTDYLARLYRFGSIDSIVFLLFMLNL